MAAFVGEVRADFNMFLVKPGEELSGLFESLGFRVFENGPVEFVLCISLFYSRDLIPFSTFNKFSLFLSTSGRTWP